MKATCLLPALVAACVVRVGFSFASFSASTSSAAKTVSLAAKGDNRYDDYRHRDALALNKARTDIRNFLTQRAIQSFVFLLINCRDQATVRWLEVSPFRFDLHSQ